MACNEERTVGPLLEALLASRPAGGPIERITVVSSACRDRTDEIVRVPRGARPARRPDRRARAAGKGGGDQHFPCDPAARNGRDGDLERRRPPGAGRDGGHSRGLRGSGRRDGGREARSAERRETRSSTGWRASCGTSTTASRAAARSSGSSWPCGPLSWTRSTPRAQSTNPPWKRPCMSAGGRLVYVPRPPSATAAPRRFANGCRRRRQIAFGHLWLRTRTGYSVSTGSGAAVLTVWLSEVLPHPSRWLPGLALVATEVLARLEARRDFRRGDRDYAIWDIATSTKAGSGVPPS